VKSDGDGTTPAAVGRTSSAIEPGNSAAKMYFAFDGKSLISPTVFFRFAARTSGGICANQSESRKVLFSVKSGSLNTSRNSHPWSSA